MKHKSESLDCLRRYIQEMRVLLHDHKVKTLIGLRSDNGGEYTGVDFKNFCKNHGIRQDFGIPYGPQDNGVAEKSWHVLSNMARSLRIQAGLGKRFWAEALNTAAYILNRSRTSALGPGETPYYKMFGKHASVKHLRTFGCKAFVHDTSVKRGKFDDRAVEGIMIGYDDIGNNPKCYRIYIPSLGRYIRSGHVTFDEETFPARVRPSNIRVETYHNEKEDDVDSMKTVGAHQEDEGPLIYTSEDDDGIEDDIHQDEIPDDRDVDHVREDPSQVGATGWKDTDNIVRNMNNMGRTRSRTKAREHHRLDDGLITMGGDLAFAAASEIVNEDYHLTEDENEVRAERKKAKDAEYQAHMKNGTWELTPLPKGERCISSGWVESDKRDKDGVIVKRKARFIAKGYSPEYGYDYLQTYAPVASMTTIRLILALTCILNLELDNMDVETAYLQSDLEEKVYVKQPPGYEQYGPNGEELVCRLRKSLYGLKQSGRNWRKKIDGWFRGYGFHPSSADPCLYVKFGSSGEILVIVLYVDDLIITSNSREMVDKFKQAISREFSMKDLKELDWILGMAIKRDREKRVMEISQTAYIDMVLNKFGMADCRPVLTSMEGTLKKMDGKDVKPDSEYMKLVGSLLYAALVTRPDIAFAVQSLGKHLQGSNEEHWIAAKRVLRYLKGTREVGLKYTGNSTGSFTLVGFADADYAGDKDNRRSTSGYTFTLSHGDDVNTIDWKAKQQDVVALSSAESELISACSATQSAVYIRQLLTDLGFKQDEPTVIMEDNQACIAMSNNPITHKRTKHIDIRYHFVREKVESKEVELVYIPTQHQLADILTKPLSNIRLAMIRNRMMGYKS